MKWFLSIFELFIFTSVFTQTDTIEICDNHYSINRENDSIFIEKLPFLADSSEVNEVLFEKKFSFYLELNPNGLPIMTFRPNINATILVLGKTFGEIGPFLDEDNSDTLQLKITDGHSLPVLGEWLLCNTCFDTLNEFIFYVPDNIEIVLIPFLCEIFDKENNILGSEMELDDLYGYNLQKVLFIDLRNRNEMKCSVLKDIYSGYRDIEQYGKVKLYRLEDLEKERRLRETDNKKGD